MDKRYLYAKEEFVHVSLIDGQGNYINDDYGDFTAGDLHPLVCHKCGKNITVRQYKQGKIRDIDADDPTQIFEHIKCSK